MPHVGCRPCRACSAAITFAPVPAAMLISRTPSPSLRQSGDMLPTWVAAAHRVPYRCWDSPGLPFAAHDYKARNGVHWPAGSHAHLAEAMLINSTTLTMTQVAPSRSALRGIGSVLVLSNLCKRPADLNGGHPVIFHLHQQSEECI